MTALTMRARTGVRASDWLIPTGLLALAFIPIAAGAFRMTTLLGGVALRPQNARFFAAPIPVTLHIISVTLFSILGAFQFLSRLRRRFPGWHRAAGRVLVAAGLVAAFSGLWMAMFYTIVPADNILLHTLRLTFGLAMAASIVMGLVAIRQRQFDEHQAWMQRAYAIGMGAGTQALVQIPYVIILGQPASLPHFLLMGIAWIINLVVVEWLIRRRRSRVQS